MIPTLFNSLITLLSLSTAAGVLVHDMHLDAATAALAAPAITNNNDQAKTPFSTDPHTHPERHSFSRLFGQHAPSIQPRVGEDKKHLLQKNATKGHHPFDNYNLPMI
jgi:hypothetical protein